MSALIRRDDVYDHYTHNYQAKTPAARTFYMLFYLLPGIVGYFLLNHPAVYYAGVSLTGLSGKNYQYLIAILITFGWHIAIPFVVLTRADKLSVREVMAFIGVNRIDWMSLFVWMPLTFIVFVFVSMPYMHYVAPIIGEAVNGVAWMRLPTWSIFQPGPESLYTFPPLMMAVFFIGNFVGEELYFRGYLMKKTSFLGGWNWAVNSALFVVYHLWQIPQTWPLIGIGLIFGFYMQWRKDFWSVVVLHLLINLAWGPVSQAISPLIWR